MNQSTSVLEYRGHNGYMLQPLCADGTDLNVTLGANIKVAKIAFTEEGVYEEIYFGEDKVKVYLQNRTVINVQSYANASFPLAVSQFYAIQEAFPTETVSNLFDRAISKVDNEVVVLHTRNFKEIVKHIQEMVMVKALEDFVLQEGYTSLPEYISNTTPTKTNKLQIARNFVTRMINFAINFGIIHFEETEEDFISSCINYTNEFTKKKNLKKFVIAF